MSNDGKYKNPKWEEPEMDNWEEDWDDDDDMRDEEGRRFPFFGLGLGLGFGLGFGFCWPRRNIWA